MRMFRLAAAFAALLASVGAQALPVFVGQWQVDEGPAWDTVPTAYTGQEAAAFLFGGSPLDYVISTVDNLVANIDFMTWVSVWGIGADKVAQDFRMDTVGEYRMEGDTSAYVNDSAPGADYTNYAFRLVADEEPVPPRGNTPVDTRSVPEPAAASLVVLALAGAAASRRRAERVART